MYQIVLALNIGKYLSFFAGNSGKDLAEQYQNVLDHNRDTVYQRHLAFFHTPALAMAQTMVYYYPPGHDKQSNYLYSFIKANGIDEPSTIPTGHYVIKSKYWPAYYLRRSFSSGYKTEVSYSPMPFNRKQGRVLYSVSYNADTPTTEDRIRVTKKSNGYYSFKLDDPRYTTHSDYRYVIIKVALLINKYKTSRKTLLRRLLV